MGIEVLGPLTIDGDALELSRRDRVVLEALAARQGNPVPVDQLAEAVWGDEPPASWRKLIQGSVMRLRRRLGWESIRTAADGYQLHLAGEDIDARRFDRLAAHAQELLSSGEADRAAYLADEALSLWRGRAFNSIRDWNLGRIEAERLENLRLDVQELRVEAAMRAGRHEAALPNLRALVEEQPLRERRWRMLALALYRSGRQSEALSTLRTVRTILARELGLDPGRELVQLERAILEQDLSLQVADMVPEPSSTCPYPGLLSYQIEDADTFFGRDVELDECLRRLREHGVLAIVGPSGSGKSSLVRAGIVARLTADGDRVVVVTPGRRPGDCLSSLNGPGRRPVLVVDQCEELFSLGASPQERKRFLQDLVEHARVAPLVVCTRADRISSFSEHSAFARLTETGLYLLAPMGEEQLREAIQEPARHSGLRLEAGLVDLLVREVEGEPGALPLLSHTLRQTWRRREGRVLTIDGYRATGGIRGAIAQTAEAVYQQTPADSRPLLRDLMLRLVAPGLEGEPVPSRVPRRLLVADEQHDHLVDDLVAARLVTSDEGSVELAHEALARAWPRLRDWLEEDGDGRRQLRHLSGAADAWEAMGRPDSELYRGARLRSALEWRERSRPALTSAEADFLRAAEQRQADEHQLTVERARRDRRSNRRLRAFVAALAGLALLATATGVWALTQARAADDGARRADAGRVGALSLLPQQSDRALLLAVAANHLDDTPATRADLLAVLTRDPQLVGARRGHGSSYWGAAVNPDGRTVAVVDDENIVTVYDSRTLRQRARFDANIDGTHRQDFYPTDPMAYTPDGRTLVVGTSTLDPEPIKLVDTASYTSRAPGLPGLPTGLADVIDLQISADGSTLAASFDHYRRGRSDPVSYSALVWNLAALTQQPQRIDTDIPFAQVALSPDGSHLFLRGRHGTSYQLARFDLRAGRHHLAWRVPVHDGGTFVALDITGDGRHLISTQGRQVILLDPRDGHLQRRLGGHTAPITAVTSSHDGRLVAAASDDQTVLVWSLTDGRVQDTLQVHTSNLWGLAFSADDHLVYTAGVNRDLQAWDVDGARRFMPRLRARTPYFDESSDGWAVPSPNGRTIAYITQGDAARLTFLDLKTRKSTTPVDTGHESWGDVAWSPDSSRLVSVGHDGWARLWNPRSGQLLLERPVSQAHIAGVDYDARGGSIVAADRAGRVFRIDATTLRHEGKDVRLPGARSVWALSAPGGRAVLLTGEPLPPAPYISLPLDRGYAVVDLIDGKILRTGSLPIHQVMQADVSPDGRWLAVGDSHGAVVTVDLATGRPVRPPVTGHDGRVLFLGYGPSSRNFLTAGEDGTVRLWNGHTGELEGTVTADPGVGASAQLLPDGRTVLVASYTGSVYTWDIRPRSWVAAACRIAGRDLTHVEWHTVFTGRSFTDTCPS